MARPLLQNMSVQTLHFLPAQFTFLIILTAVFSVFTVVTFLCGSHGEEKKKTVIRLGDGKNHKPVIEKMKSRLSSKALLMAKMISWRKVQDEGKAEEYFSEEEEGENGAVWKKAIIKGEKCRPIDFSGKILYDCNGNLLVD